MLAPLPCSPTASLSPLSLSKTQWSGVTHVWCIFSHHFLSLSGETKSAFLGAHTALFINNNKARPPQGFTRERLHVLFGADEHLSVANLQTPRRSVWLTRTSFGFCKTRENHAAKKHPLQSDVCLLLVQSDVVLSVHSECCVLQQDRSLVTCSCRDGSLYRVGFSCR